MLLIILLGIITFGTITADFSVIYTAMAYYSILIVSLCIHESAHAITAYLCGDEQQLRDGRISLNPGRHFPSWRDVLRPTRLMPVEVRVNRLKIPYLSYPLVKLSGPLANLLLCIVGAALSSQHSLFSIIAICNFFIMASNLAPILCLDGGFFYVWILGIDKMTRKEGLSSHNIDQNIGFGAKFYSIWILVVWICSFYLLHEYKAVI